MKGIVCVKPNELKMITLDRPKLKEGEALVKTRRIGICGTDMHAYRGNQPYFTYPRVLGHELSGIIEEIGVNQEGLVKGDQVTVIPYLECGNCVACKNSKTNCCTNMKVFGVHIDGGMCESISIPTDHLVKVNDISLDLAALIEPLSIGAHAVNRSSIVKGENALVIGAGPIGLAVMKFAKQKGANVIAMDINEERLEFCKRWAKVDHIVNGLDNPMERLSALTNKEFPTVVYDATGNLDSMTKSFNYVAHGGKLVYVGLVKGDITFSDPDFHKKELTLMGSRNATREDYEYVLGVLKSGEIIADDFISHRCTFDKIVDSFESWLLPESRVIKALVEL
ncbi:zinc-binding alcohol dehydrogenase family protein [Metabacillus litoralis]|uniref:zinc-binding alcohol dehydrogenase family protein n=1 Tax=Metabacillus litoralis TaxID=152268 RepID=UPI0020418965|nr:zinc-binding alcohol dehydrogenase family protein [Metabacillus litoralis]MCM3410851.1 zinc-binding alcohol dehydrogenase family protein [Metabacillus litoralis]